MECFLKSLMQYKPLKTLVTDLFQEETGGAEVELVEVEGELVEVALCSILTILNNPQELWSYFGVRK